MDLSQTIRYRQWDQEDASGNTRALHYVSSMTVQTVLLHPAIQGSVYWVLNRKETESIQQGRRKTPKFRGWGNPGGGVELIDCVNNHGAPHSSEEIIGSCGKRELEDETGFVHFEFKRNNASKLPFLHYDNRDGHSVIVLLAQLQDFASIPIKEVEEIICGSWFNLAVSPVELFQDGTDLPYWSHVKRTITVFNYLAKQTSNNDVVHAIHPLWNLVSPLITQDARFPQGGYLISAPDWYDLMRTIIKERKYTLDFDFIYEQLGPQIDEKRRQENDRLLIQKRSDVLPPDPDPLCTIPRIDDFRHVSEQEKRIAQYEEDYRRWVENILTT